MEQRVSIDLELFGQGKHRRQVAEAGLSRTEFEIAASELALVIRTARAFDGVLYRQEKLRLLEETVALNEKAAAQIKALAGGKVRQADEILARTEVDAARALVGPGRGLYGTAWAELYTSLGSVDEHIVLRGRLDPPLPPLEEEALLREALERRPELHARQAAVGEAEARLRLEMSNRFGNPNFGPDFEYNETRVYFIGAQLVMPLPVLNTRRGEILQRTAERDRAILSLRALELQVRQQVQAALRRLQEAEKAAASYRTDLLPNLQKAVESLEQLFLANDPSVDVVKVLDVRRKLLKARDGYLDALWELSQARADLAAAVGEPSLAIVAESPPP
jgi:cobalt-zinc-cadmium efflux system outer membrane protein